MDEDPAAVFARAQEAMEGGDMVTFFRCLDRKDQVRLGANAIAGLLAENEKCRTELARLGEEHQVPSAAIEALRDHLRELTRSAEQLRSGSVAPTPGASEAHRRIVKRYDAEVAALVNGVADISAFVAAAAAAFRRAIGGGIVSSSLLVGEHLEDVVVEKDRGWATRVGVTASGTRYTEDVGFGRERSGTWRIRLFAKRPRRSPPRGGRR